MLFLSEDGSPNLVMVDNPRLALMDQNNEIRAVQHLDSDGQPVISLRDAAGQVRSELRLGEGGSPSIRLFDDEPFDEVIRSLCLVVGARCEVGALTARVDG